MIISVGIQFIAILALIFQALGWRKKKTANLVTFHIFATTCYAIHYLLLGSNTGFYINLVGIIRLVIVFSLEQSEENNPKPKKQFHKLIKNLILFILVIIYVIIIIITWHGIASLFSGTASILYTVLFYKCDLPIKRKGQIAVSFLIIVYSVLIFSYGGIFAEIIILSQAILAIIIYDMKYKGLKVKIAYLNSKLGFNIFPVESEEKKDDE